MEVLVRAVQRDLGVGEATNAVGDRGLTAPEHAGVADEADVAILELRRVFLDEGLEVGGAGLFFTLEHDGELDTAADEVGYVPVGADGLEEGHHLPFVIDGARATMRRPGPPGLPSRITGSRGLSQRSIGSTGCTS